MTQRAASHAGSWYSDDGPTLSKQLDQWLDQVPDTINNIGSLPQPGARIIIAPHAGYAYSGPAAAWAYKSLDLSRAKRIFLLGPSHHAYLPNCALSAHTTYSTPLGPLPLDLPTIQTLHATGHFGTMSPRTDEDEHSLEMHLPYIHRVLSRAFPSLDSADFPPLVPILVGSTSPSAEITYGKLLAPYLADPTSVVVVSSDFCHWGARFAYTYYIPSAPSASSPVPFPVPSSSSSSPSPSAATPAPATSPAAAAAATLPAPAQAQAGYHLTSKPQSKPRPETPIHASIAHIDLLSMQAIESGSHAAFLADLRETGNTVCGRHPIGVVMAALEVLREGVGDGGAGSVGGEGGIKGRFKFVRYERSSECVSVSDSSVSYASAFAAL